MLALGRPQGLAPRGKRVAPGPASRETGKSRPQTGLRGRAVAGRTGGSATWPLPLRPQRTPSLHPAAPTAKRGPRRPHARKPAAGQARLPGPGGRRPTPARLPEPPPGPAAPRQAARSRVPHGALPDVSLRDRWCCRQRGRGPAPAPAMISSGPALPFAGSPRGSASSGARRRSGQSRSRLALK